jgi:D-sedoheptulose 7-phosphate isomerase
MKDKKSIENSRVKLNFFVSYFSNVSSAVEEVDVTELGEISEIVLDANRKNGKVIIVGNGGSAAMASHLSVDFTKAAQIRAINFNEADLLTCFANDYGYEHWVERALEAYADDNDLVFLISSSGRSPNIINGALKAKAMGLKVVTLSGFSSDNALRKLGDVNLWCDSQVYNVIEMTHHIWLLAIVDYIIQSKVAVER